MAEVKNMFICWFVSGPGARLSQANLHFGFCVWRFLIESSQPSRYVTSKIKPQCTQTSISARFEAESMPHSTEKWAKPGELELQRNYSSVKGCLQPQHLKSPLAFSEITLLISGLEGAWTVQQRLSQRNIHSRDVKNIL